MRIRQKDILVEQSGGGFICLSVRLLDGELFKRKYYSMDYSLREAKADFISEANAENAKLKPA